VNTIHVSIKIQLLYLMNSKNLIKRINSTGNGKPNEVGTGNVRVTARLGEKSGAF
jgi:hypothetical protein